jgi:hypothetical protein
MRDLVCKLPIAKKGWGHGSSGRDLPNKCKTLSANRYTEKRRRKKKKKKKEKEEKEKEEKEDGEGGGGGRRRSSPRLWAWAMTV